MSFISSKSDTSPLSNTFCVVKINERYKVILNQNGNVSSYFVDRVVNNSNIAGIVKYMVEFVGADLIGADLKLNVAEYSTMRSLRGNNSMGTIKTRFGELYFKKVNCNNVRVNYDLFSKPEYNIVASMHGYLRLINDDNFSHCIIMETCYPVGVISHNNMICSLQALRRLHKDGYLHGDCNKDNIMKNRFGSLVLVDPVNLLNGRILFRNADLYSDLSMSSDLRAFVYSCFELQAAILNVDITMVKFTNVGYIGFNLTEGTRLVDFKDLEYDDIMLYMGVGIQDDVQVMYDAGVDLFTDNLNSPTLDSEDGNMHSESEGDE